MRGVMLGRLGFPDVLVRPSATPAPPQGQWAVHRPLWAVNAMITDTTFSPPNGTMLSGEQRNLDLLATTTSSVNPLFQINGTDATGPYGSNVYRTFYAGGDPGAGDGGTTLFGAGARGWRRIYFCVAVKVDAFYRMHATGGEKFWYPRILTNGGITSSCMLNWHIQGSQTALGPTWCFYLDPQVGDPRQYQPDNGVYPVKGEWNIIEVEMEMNTPGNTNGLLNVWVNGAIAIARTNVLYSVQAAQSVFDGMYFNGVRGGPADSAPVPVGGQSRYYNRLAFYASTAGS